MEQPREQTLGGFIKEFRKEASAYIEARLELTRLSTYEKTAILASATLFFVIVSGLASITILLFSIALAMYLGKLMGAAYLGFATVAFFYLFLAFLMFLFRKTINEKIHSSTLDILMKSDQKKQEERNDLER